MKEKPLSIHKPAGWFESFLWMCAGADRDILEQCPDADRIKYQGIGGIIFATGILAFISSSYAFWTVFSPKDGLALEPEVYNSAANVAMTSSIFGGLVWGLVIFNIDRFIVSSTGSGDGTSSISASEFFQALPRMLMAGLIGLCLSTPLELRILKPEIDTYLHQEQQELRRDLDEETELRFAEEEERMDDKIIQLKSEIQNLKDIQENRRLELQEKRRNLELEVEGKTGSGKAGRGPAYREKLANLNLISDEFEVFKKENSEEIQLKNSEITETKEKLLETRQKEKNEKITNEQQAHQMDGLLARIKIAHEQGGKMRWVLTLLLLSIEMGPIFFKMMIAKSTYDYLKEQKMEAALASKGLYFDTKPITDGEKQGGLFGIFGGSLKEKRFIKNLYLERQQKEMDEQLNLEMALTRKVHAEYQRRMEADIEANLDDYIKDNV